MIGILALQGAVEPHENHFRALGLATLRVRCADDLKKVDGLVLPGGESTTMLHLLRVFAMLDPLVERSRAIPFWGICAGAILMARALEGASKGPGQFSLGIMDFTIERNAYGRQLDSFTDNVELSDGRRELATFIRAPKFRNWGPGVSVLGSYDNEPVFLGDGRHWASAFHPELSQNLYFHEQFAKALV